ncbi:oxidoreductase [Wenjunlia vitaminophila]|uniref:Oxidoreductase n=1 Tax=Wenjunlia vitaminophila TaxID=76728 RepID=A0A0T6LUU5_WENVI|nr:Gfo/Idh/MocA family oxidoreductase [Wenjunlia vitaminophila]KRV49885.1 oxidoreductase [Wenjunlia vitaminophila]
MRTGVIGLGDIALKAYLPVLTTEPGLELHLHTRTRQTLDRVGDQYRIPAEQRHQDLQSLIRHGRIEVAFVHAPTDQHVPIVERLLDAGVHVYVDKPLDYRLEGAERLVTLAERRERSLSVGFNRRHAPAYAQLLEHPRDLIVMQKNRAGSPAAPREVVFDDFIHVVDTLRFLVPGTVDHVDVRTRVRDGLLHQVVLQLSGDGFAAVGMMNRVSGSAEERLEVSGQGAKREVVNLAEVIDHRGQPTVRRRGDWVPVSRQRGIEQVSRAFLEALRSGKVLHGGEALATHELCERVVRAAEGRHR